MENIKIEININTQPTTEEIINKIIEEINKPKPVFVAMATFDGPTLVKTIYR